LGNPNLSDSANAALIEISKDMTPEQLAGVESSALEAYATTVARLRDARKRIDVEGLIVSDSKGQPIPHPALAIEKSLEAQMRAWLTRYMPKPVRARR